MGSAAFRGVCSDQRGLLGEPEADVEVLHGLSRRAFGEVVDAGEEQELSGVGIELEPDLAAVREGDVLRVRKLSGREHAHEPFVSVRLREGVGHGFLGAAFGGVQDDRGLDAAVGRHQVRDEVHVEGGQSGGDGELLLDLGQVAVAGHAVGAHALVAFREDVRQIDFASGSGHAAHAARHDAFGRSELGRQDRGGREQDARDVAARAGDQFRGADLFAVAFGEAVDRAGEQSGRGMVDLVVLFVLVERAQTEVRADVNDGESGIDERLGEFVRETVGERQESGVAAGFDGLDVRHGE